MILFEVTSESHMTQLVLKIRSANAMVSMKVDASIGFEALKVLICEQLKLPINEAGHGDIDLLTGFPPLILELKDEEPIGGKIANNESIRVQPRELSGVQKLGEVKATKSKRAGSNKQLLSTNKSSSMHWGVGKIATFQGNSSTPSSVLRSTTTRSTVRFGARMASLSNPSGGSRTSTAQRRGPRIGSTDAAHSEGDIAEHLLAAVSGAAGSRSKMLRKVFRKTVSLQYGVSQALARLQAVFAASYAFSPIAGDGVGALPRVRVRYPKGAGSRGVYEDTIELLPRELLYTMLRLPLQQQEDAEKDEGEGGESFSRDVLVPANLARASPRIFWSLVHLHGCDLLASLTAILSPVSTGDLFWLQERKRELSAKAKANLQQAAELQELQTQRVSKRRKVKVGAVNDLLADVAAAASVEDSSARDELELELEQLVTQVLPLLDLRSIATPGHLLQLQLALALGTSSSSSNAQLALGLATCDDLPQLLATYSNTSSTTSSPLTLRQLQDVVASVQTLLQRVLFLYTLSGHQKLVIALFRLRIRCLRELLLWKGAAEGLHAALLQLDSTLARTISLDEGRHMLLLTEHLLQRWPFLQAVQASDDFIDDCSAFLEDLFSPPDEAQAEGEEWCTEVSAHRWVGCRARLLVDLPFGTGDDTRGEEVSAQLHTAASVAALQAQGVCWEDADVVGYLPATEDEPMALWRLLIDVYQDAAGKEGRYSRERVVDLEEHELQVALDRHQHWTATLAATRK